MVEIKTYSLDHQDLIKAIIKELNIHEGIWQIIFEFGLGAANLQTPDNQINPSIIVPIKKVGITKVDAESSIAVDAAKVNPKK